MSNLDPFDLSRFLDAQYDTFDDACDELKAGRKTTHWMWFMFPQVAGLGHSPMAVRYAIRSRAEARAYLTYSVLGERLIKLTNLAIHAPATSVQDLFGYPDHLKFHSVSRDAPPEMRVRLSTATSATPGMRPAI